MNKKFPLLGLLILSTALPVNSSSFLDIFVRKTTVDQGFLPASEAFVFSQSQRGDMLILHWDISPDYYLYRNKLKMSINGVEQPIENIPDGALHNDQNFGETQVFESELIVQVPLADVPVETEITIRYQGCAGRGLCYPPVDQKFVIN